MTEKELQLAVARLCRVYGLYHFHVPDSRRMTAGLPDCIIIGTKVLWRELKTDGALLTSEQSLISWKLQAARQDFRIWRPRDLCSGEIDRQLRMISNQYATED